MRKLIFVVICVFNLLTPCIASEGNVHKQFVVHLVNANTEYSFTFPKWTIDYLIKTRNNNAFRISNTQGIVASPGPLDPYITVPAGQLKFPDTKLLTKDEFYLASDTAGVIVEIEVILQ